MSILRKYVAFICLNLPPPLSPLGLKSWKHLANLQEMGKQTLQDQGGWLENRGADP
jgi:hypothetical protein